MAIGDSGRIVLEVDPELKKRLYASLALEQMTLKDWFIGMAEQFIITKHPEILPKTTENK